MKTIEQVLVLIPAYNEGERVAAVVQQGAEKYPVLVVDDGSIDDTAQQARQVGAHVLPNPGNLGKGAALRNGFRYALEEGYTCVVTLDADGQHDPSEIPAFLDTHARHQADLVIGFRDFSQMPLIRRISNTLGTWIFSRAVGAHIRDNQSGYRLLSCRMMEAVLDSTEGGFEFEVEMIVQCLQKKYVLDWVPIRTIYRDEKSHIRPLHHAKEFLRVACSAYCKIQRSKRTED